MKKKILTTVMLFLHLWLYFCHHIQVNVRRIQTCLWFYDTVFWLSQFLDYEGTSLFWIELSLLSSRNESIQSRNCWILLKYWEFTVYNAQQKYTVSKVLISHLYCYMQTDSYNKKTGWWVERFRKSGRATSDHLLFIGKVLLSFLKNLLKHTKNSFKWFISHCKQKRFRHLDGK